MSVFQQGVAGPTASHKVQLVVSQLGGIPGAAAYHSSVMVDSEEFSFSDAGISRAQGAASHAHARQPAKTIDMGMSVKSGAQMFAALQTHFMPGTYDLLRKNCNSFSDAALFYLVKRRLSAEYKTLERLGATCPQLVQSISGGAYTPNPQAARFDSEVLIRELDPDKHWNTRGQVTGGTAASSSPESIRAARLARFSEGPLNSVPVVCIAEARREASIDGPVPPRDGPTSGSTASGAAAEEGMSTASLEADAELARLLQEAEDAAVSADSRPGHEAAASPQATITEPEAGQQPPTYTGSAGGAGLSNPTPAEQLRSDEAFARELQAEEDARAGRPSGAQQGAARQPGSQQGAGRGGYPVTGQDFLNGLVGALSGGGVAAGRGRGQQQGTAATAGARGGQQRGAPPDAQAAMQGFIQGFAQITAQVQQLQQQQIQQTQQRRHQLRQQRQGSGGAQGPAAPGGMHLRGTTQDPVQNLQNLLRNLEGTAGQFNQQLQHLQHQLGARGRPGQLGASQSVLEANTVVTTFDGPEATANGQCMVCLENFNAGDELRILPCLHRYHKSCVDPWLHRNAKCPSCNHRFVH